MLKRKKKIIIFGVNVFFCHMCMVYKQRGPETKLSFRSKESVVVST